MCNMDSVAAFRAHALNPEHPAMQGSISPAILYILGIISKSPWEAVKVVVKAPAAKEP